MPLRDKRGKILKWCGAATDIEDRQRAQQLQASLTHIKRVNSMGEHWKIIFEIGADRYSVPCGFTSQHPGHFADDLCDGFSATRPI